MKCLYCGYDNIKSRSQNPIRCPRCGNPYRFAPVRDLTGRWTKQFSTSARKQI